jgi:hypothetical protein
MSLAVIKRVFREALAQELIDASPAHGVSSPKIMVKPRRFLTWEEVSKKSFGGYTPHIRFMAYGGPKLWRLRLMTSAMIEFGSINQFMGKQRVEQEFDLFHLLAPS